MSTWILLIWITNNHNYNYNPTVIDGFSRQHICEKAGRAVLEQSAGWMKAKFTCINKQ